MALHPALDHLAGLIGTWRGQGHGEYPTITSFDYTDEWQFMDIGKPFLLFVERTWNAADAPMHTETGYLRAPSPDVIEIVAAIPTGQAECGSGTCATGGGGVRIVTDAAVTCTPKAKRVDRIVRTFDLSGTSLAYQMDMAAVGQGITLHLTSHLTRVD